MKESTLIELKNKVETLGSVVHMMHQELSNIKDLAVGTMELVKHFEGYEKAIEDLKASIADEAGVDGQFESPNTTPEQEAVLPEDEA